MIEQSLRCVKDTRRQFTMVPGQLHDWCVDESGYHPQTAGGRQLIHDRVAKDLINHLFGGNGVDPDLNELEAACGRLEDSMKKLANLNVSRREETEQWREKTIGLGKGDMTELMDSGPDPRFGHSWIPRGPDPGWYWIPKGRITLDIIYPASPWEVRRFGYTAKKLRAISAPKILSQSFAAAVMANHKQGRVTGKRRQEEWEEDWMEEDDLLGPDTRHELDLRHRLLEGRGGGEERRAAGYNGHRYDSYGGRDSGQGPRDQGRSERGGRLTTQGRLESSRSNTQQGAPGGQLF